MICLACGHDCADTAKFCGACGARLEWRCASCATANPGSHRFCAECGTARPDGGQRVEAAPQPEPRAPGPTATTSAQAGPRDTNEGERRHLTVMFCDLVDSTSLSGSLDPEELQAVVLAYQEACAGAIESNGGYIAHYMGDGILAYFGFPIADEQATVRAVRAGRAVVQSIQATRDTYPDVAVRVGIHSGVTVVADMGAGLNRQLRDVVGETPNIAARIQSVASPGQVVISDAVKRSCEGYFELRSLGSFDLKGVNRPMELFEAVADTGAANRLDVATAKQRLTPLVGRDDEVERLVAAWRRTQLGDGQVVWLSGEAGIGKSRLVRELVNRVRHDDGIEIEFRCSALHQSSSLHPSADQFRRYLIAACGEISVAGIEQLADECGTPRGLAVPVVAELLGVPLIAPYRPTEGSADKLRQHTLDVIARLIDDRATKQPVLVVIEDLQWLDSTSAELADRFIGAEQRNDVMTLVTHRSDFTPDIPAAAHHRQLTLERLQANDILSIIHSIAGDDGLGIELDEQISARTEGIPLFAEELTQLFVGNEGPEAVASVPSTLRDSLMARIDRLGPEAGIMRTLSVLGREATDGLLYEVSGLDRDTFQQQIAKLLHDRLLIRRGDGVHAVYAFKHALQQEVVYDSMLRSTRRQIHARVADALESRFAERTVTEPEMSARHFEMSGDPERALVYLLRAGDRAIAISAHDEALNHLRHARDLVALLPEGADRDVHEIAVLVKLGVPTTAKLGYGSPEAEEAYARAQALCERVGENVPVYPALYGLFRTRLLRAEYTTALDIANRLEALSLADPTRVAMSVGAERALGSVLLYMGRDHRAALGHLERALAAPDAHRPGAYLGDLNDVVDPIITCRSYGGWAHWLLGDATTARTLSNESIVAGRRLAHPFTLGLALCFDTWLCQFEGDAAATADRAAEGLEHALIHGFPFWQGWANVLLGWGRAQAGDADAPAAMRVGIDEWQAQGSALGKSYFLGLVGESEAMLGDHIAAEQTLREAAALAEAMDEHFWMPELWRQRAEVLRVLGRPAAEVDELLAAADSLALAQGAVAMQQRIAASRSR